MGVALQILQIFDPSNVIMRSTQLRCDSERLRVGEWWWVSPIHKIKTFKFFPSNEGILAGIMSALNSF